jgi:hypothetical protein
MSWIKKVLAIKCSDCGEYMKIPTVEGARNIGEFFAMAKKTEKLTPIFVCKGCFKYDKNLSFVDVGIGYVIYTSPNKSEEKVEEIIQNGMHIIRGQG